MGLGERSRSHDRCGQGEDERELIVEDMLEEGIANLC